MNKLIFDIIIDINNDNLEDAKKKINLFGEIKEKQMKICIVYLDIINYNIIKNYQDIKGLYYIENFLKNNEIKFLKKMIENNIKFNHISNNPYSRRVAQYGYYYSYKNINDKLVKAPDIPKKIYQFVDQVRINKIFGYNFMEKSFDQLIINEYKPD